MVAAAPMRGVGAESTVDALTFRHPAFLANEQPSSEILMKESGVKEGRCDLTHSHTHTSI